MTTKTWPDHLVTNDRLAACQANLSDWARNTIGDIYARAELYGNSLTPRQHELVLKLVREAEAKTAQPARKSIDLFRINQMFGEASKHLKKPRVAFVTDEGEFTVSAAPLTGKNPGCLYVKSGSGTYLGKIDYHGSFSASREAPASVFTALDAFAADPAAAALSYGQSTGNCCFCVRPLTDQRSVTAGYGPICADRYGLPWGA